MTCNDMETLDPYILFKSPIPEGAIVIALVMTLIIYRTLVKKREGRNTNVIRSISGTITTRASSISPDKCLNVDVLRLFSNSTLVPTSTANMMVQYKPLPMTRHMYVLSTQKRSLQKKKKEIFIYSLRAKVRTNER